MTAGRQHSRLLDAGIVAAISLFAAFGSGSRTWAGFNSPDSEFYASLALFGNDVTDRALEPAYTWTRLGFIAPVRLLVTAMDPWLGFALWRLLLIAIIIGSLYAIVRLVSTRELAIIVALFAALNTMVLSYVGNPYLTGTILAATMLLLALAAWEVFGTPRRRWLPALLSGAVAGWLVMLNPYALMLGMTMWLALRAVGMWTAPAGRARALGRDALLGLAGFVVVFAGCIVAGRLVFPGRNWVRTYLDWNSRLDYSSFVGDPDVWRHDIGLLVPLGAMLIAVIVVIAKRSAIAAGALAVAVANLVFTWGYIAVVPGPWLEAPHYVAKLWPGALVAVALSFGALVGRRTLGPPAWIVTAVAVPLVIWAGHWDRDLSGPQGLGILAVGLVLVVSAAVLLARGPALAAALAVAVALSGLAIGAQLLQNGRGLLGIYGQYPFRAAYVDFDGELLMRSKVAAEEFVLAQTSSTDRIGIWTDPARLTAAIAAMQLYGKYNNVGSYDVLNDAEKAKLRTLAPTALAMYAPTRAQVDAFWSSLPPDAGATAPDCIAVPYLGIGSPEAFACVTHLHWQG